MNRDRFDNLTRSLARSHALAKLGRTTICHKMGNGYTVITVADAILPVHYGHGDFPYIDCCTDGECPPLSTCQDGACVPRCIDANCAANESCQSGVCTPFSCPPHLVPIDHACQHPCANWQGHCSDPDAMPIEHNCNCMSLVSGEAICMMYSSVFDGGLGYCVTDEHCQTAGSSGYTWRCLRNPLWEEGGLCYGDPTFCTDWNVL